jgi:hypothetical protein
MTTQAFKPSARWALAAICLGTMITGAAAGSFTRECAVRDLRALMLIEARQRSNVVAAEKLNDALFAMMTARLVCHEGRVPEALAMYDEILNSIASNPFLTDRLH